MMKKLSGLPLLLATLLNAGGLVTSASAQDSTANKLDAMMSFTGTTRQLPANVAIKRQIALTINRL